ncbi:MAG: hypothetical protein JO185_09090 [Acidobacteriaceae bacterium]|nr:hypothetical protein [Acidobacteriaceae bacterium]MBV9676477.1 hypothetical protein [Acidobacteriaceae bacterium]
MDIPDFDLLLKNYKSSVDKWVAAIRAEESLATADHSIVAMERWDEADGAVQEAEESAKKARDEYQNALRQKNYGF